MLPHAGWVSEDWQGAVESCGWERLAVKQQPKQAIDIEIVASFDLPSCSV